MGDRQKHRREHFETISLEKLKLFIENWDSYVKEKEIIYEQFKAKKYVLKKQEDRAMDKLRNKLAKTIKAKVKNNYV